ncbi:hypothetical protein Trydic_g22781 [Trypoxylus dichotomus]
MLLLVLFAVIAGVQCHPQSPNYEILEQEFIPLQETGSNIQKYSYAFTTSNGIHRRENGFIGPNSNGMVVRGRYYYTSPEGRFQNVNYIADFNGFRIIKGGIPELAISSIAG